MLLKDLLAKINEEVKANSKVLNFEVKIDQCIGPDANANYILVYPSICRGEKSTVTIG